MSEPKFKPGDAVTAWNYIAKPPLVIVSNYDPNPGYWRCRTPGGGIVLVHEDQLRPAREGAVNEPKFQVGDRVKDRRNGQPGVVGKVLNDGSIRVKLSSNFLWWYDPHEIEHEHPPEPPPHHDGQANTSGCCREAEPRGPSILRKPLLAMAAKASCMDDPHEYVRQFWEKFRGEKARAKPSLLTVLEGIHDWQQVDPANRRAHISLSGRTATVHVTTLPDMGARKIKFCSAYSADEVRHILDDVALFGAAHPEAEVTMARNDLLITEDTGEAD